MAISLARYRRIFSHVLPQWPALFAVVGLSILLSVSAALQPWPLKILVDYALDPAALPATARSLLLANGIEPSGLALVTLVLKYIVEQRLAPARPEVAQ